MRAWLCLVALAAGCDARATASEPGAGGRAEQKSREYESCGASMQCQDHLRCFDQVCRRTARSAVGDYHAALGAAAHARGDHEVAIAAYAQALGQYDAEKVALPPEIDCAYGAALVAAQGKKEHAELGARVLHRCVLAVPVGSALRDRAISQLTTLGDAGLDPILLGASKTADLYLTKAPSRRPSDRVKVELTAAPPPTARSFPLVTGKLTEDATRPDFVACWEAYAAATHKAALLVTLGMKASYVQGEYEDDPGVWVIKLEPASSSLAGAEAIADRCVRQVVEPALKGLKTTDGFQTKLTLQIY
ncbi:MAG: hypothetical protein ACTHU0_40105 [Kofleriaceae bacterium]